MPIALPPATPAPIVPTPTPAPVVPVAPAAPAPVATDSHHVRLCPYKKGIRRSEFMMQYVLWQVAGILSALGSSIVTASLNMWLWALSAVLAAVIWIAVFTVWLGGFVRTIPEFAFVVMARDDQVNEVVYGRGIHFGIVGDEFHKIARNPIVVEVTVKNVKLKDDAVLKNCTVKLTVRPSARIANALWQNTYASWVIEGLKVGHEVATHNVQSAIQRPVQGLMTTVLPNITSEVFDSCRLGFTLLIEGEITLKEPLHKMPEEWLRITGSSSVPPSGVNALENLLKLYQQYHDAIQERMNQIGAEWDQNEEAPVSILQPIADRALSHHEVEVGCTLDHLEAVDAQYDEATLESRRKRFDARQTAAAAKDLLAAVSEHVGEDGMKDVPADQRHLGALAVLNKATTKGLIVTGGDKKTRDAAIHGETMGGGT